MGPCEDLGSPTEDTQYLPREVGRGEETCSPRLYPSAIFVAPDVRLTIKSKVQERTAEEERGKKKMKNYREHVHSDREQTTIHVTQTPSKPLTMHVRGPRQTTSVGQEYKGVKKQVSFGHHRGRTLKDEAVGIQGGHEVVQRADGAKRGSGSKARTSLP